MPKQKIDTLLSHLREQFVGSEASPETAKLLRQLEERSTNNLPSDETEGDYRQMLETLTVQLEAEHPVAGKMIRETLKALENMGI